MTGSPGIVIGLSLLAGLMLGSAYFALLYHCVRLQASAAPVWPVAALNVLRIGGAVAAFWALAQLGAWPLLAALAGFLIVRFVAQRLVSTL
jgi:F1F0 ATPase subunit 2